MSNWSGGEAARPSPEYRRRKLWRNLMSESMNSQDPGNPVASGSPYGSVDREYPAASMEQSSRSTAMSQYDLVEAEPPGLVTFAAVMMFVLGAFQVVWAIVEFVNAAWLSSVTYGNFNGHLWLWGILDAIVAIAAFYAGYDILRGGTFGRIFGVAVASVSAVRWFFYLPASPWIGIVMIAVDIIIIYALVAHGEFFNASSAR
jgi:hypothetical protein